jgi:hypothetical protein
MDWHYVAGLFDGEGTISYGGKNRTQVAVAVTQSKPNVVLLEALADFLDDEEIVFSWGEQPKYYRITISAQAEVRSCLDRMIPHLILKKDRAIEAIRFLDAKDQARNRRETACKYGHPRTPENTYIHEKTGKKSCLECRRIRASGAIPGYVRD